MIKKIARIAVMFMVYIYKQVAGRLDPSIQPMFLVSCVGHIVLLIFFTILPMVHFRSMQAATLQTIRIQSLAGAGLENIETELTQMDLTEPIKVTEPIRSELPKKIEEKKQVKEEKKVEEPKKEVKKEKKKEDVKKQEKPKIKEKTVEEKIKDRLKALEQKKWIDAAQYEKESRAEESKEAAKGTVFSANKNKMVRGGPSIGGLSSSAQTESDFPYAWYLVSLQNKVKLAWDQPKESLHNRFAHVKFDLREDGQISNIEIMQSSGSSFFDESVLKAVKNANPAPPLPRQFSFDSLTVTIIFELE